MSIKPCNENYYFHYIGKKYVPGNSPTNRTNRESLTRGLRGEMTDKALSRVLDGKKTCIRIQNTESILEIIIFLQ